MEEQHRAVTLARHGVVSAPHYLASGAGLRILQAGGNAVDAAIAANAVLNVAMPIMCGTGGDIFMMIYDAASDGLYALDSAGRTAGAATVDYFRSRGYTSMPMRGPLTVSVPGCVDGWHMASERFGRLGLAKSLAPAIQYA